MGDHTEVVQIDYDPEKTSFADLLEVFWQEHDPRVQSSSRQYHNVLLYHDEEQERIALESRDRLGGTRKVRTRMEPYSGFHIAEDYHQKHYLRGRKPIWKALRAVYPTFDALRDSTAAARLNGYLGGHLTRDRLVEEIGKWGLSEAEEKRILNLIGVHGGE
jgi:hypothetical protein